MGEEKEGAGERARLYRWRFTDLDRRRVAKLGSGCHRLEKRDRERLGPALIASGGKGKLNSIT